MLREDDNEVSNSPVRDLNNNGDERQPRFNPSSAFFSRFYRTMDSQMHDQDMPQSRRHIKIKSLPLDDYRNLLRTLLEDLEVTISDRKLKTPEKTRQFLQSFSRTLKRNDGTYLRPEKNRKSMVRKQTMLDSNRDCWVYPLAIYHHGTLSLQFLCIEKN